MAVSLVNKWRLLLSRRGVGIYREGMLTASGLLGSWGFLKDSVEKMGTVIRDIRHDQFWIGP